MAQPKRARGTRARRTGPRRSSAPGRKRDQGVDVLTSFVLLVIGACSLGAEEVAKRLAATGEAVPTTGQRRRQSITTFGWIAADLAVQSADAVRRLAGRAGDVARRSGPAWALIDGLVGAPPLASMRRRGRSEVAQGRRMVTRLLRETTRQSVRDIADTAIKEVAESPEVATLVRKQSIGIGTGTILEVRATSEQADDRIERRVRSWLHILRPEDGGEHLTTKPLHPPEPVA
jgi:hypothetical protein